MQFKDFEDCLQDECARMVNADYLVTCNLKDFKAAKTKVYNPDEIVSDTRGNRHHWCLYRLAGYQ